MFISWGTAKSLIIFLGPYLIPKIIAFYRSLKAPASVTPTHLSFRSSLALNAILISGLVALLSTLPFLAAPNIFFQTSSRLQTPTNVLFTRLAGLHDLAPWEESLRTTFEAGGLEARLLYLRFGPDVLSTCTFADPKSTDASTTYLIYALPKLLGPHVAHLIVLGLATSSSLTGTDAGRWRFLATTAAIALGGLELLAVMNYDHTANAKATRITEVTMFYWQMKIYRGIAIAAVDAVLGLIIYLAATQRAFVVPKTPAEKAEVITRTMEGSLAKMRGLGAIRNVVYRNTTMRANVDRYWVHEERLMTTVLEDRDVKEAMDSAFDTADMVRLQREAQNYVDAVIPSNVMGPTS